MLATTMLLACSDDRTELSGNLLTDRSTYSPVIQSFQTTRWYDLEIGVRIENTSDISVRFLCGGMFLPPLARMFNDETGAGALYGKNAVSIDCEDDLVLLPGASFTRMLSLPLVTDDREGMPPSDQVQGLFRLRLIGFAGERRAVFTSEPFRIIIPD